MRIAETSRSELLRVMRPRSATAFRLWPARFDAQFFNRCFWIAIALSAHVVSAQVDLPVDSWRQLPLPVDVSEAAGFAQTPEGELFIASAEQVFIRSPFGDENGWEIIQEFTTDGDDAIVALAVIRGVGDRELVVATQSRLLVLQWEHDANASVPWDRFRYRFQVRQVAKDLPGVFSRVYSFEGEPFAAVDHSVRAWLAADSQIVPLLNLGGALEVGQPIDLRAGSAPLWEPGPKGWSFTWPYASALLTTLKPDGTADGPPADLADLMSPDSTVRHHVDIECVWRDPARDALFVGTSHGLAVAGLDEESGHRVTEFFRVEAAGLATVKLIGSTAGRLWIVTDSSDAVEGLDGPLLMEATHGRRCRTAQEFAEMKLFSEWGSGPQRVTSVFPIDDDRVFASDGSLFWEWNPGGWRSLSDSRTSLRDFIVGETGGLGMYPVVVSDLLSGKLWYLASGNEAFWQVHPVSRDGQNAKWLVPDLSGQGVWSIADGTAAAVAHGWLTFETPHGALQHGDVGVMGGPRHVRVRSLSLQISDGSRLWPASRQGGLLLPSGENVIHVESGFQQPLDWPLDDGVSLESMLPGGLSSETAWLALRVENGKSTTVVRVDLPEDLAAGEDPVLKVEPTAMSCAEEAVAVLVPDSAGNVWFATGLPGDRLDVLRWTGFRIHPFSGDAVETRDFGEIPFGETPRLYWLAPAEGLLSKDHALFTEHGITQIPQNALPFDQPDGPRLLTPEERPPGAWQKFFAEDDERRFRSVLRSGVLSPFDAPSEGMLLLTARESSAELGQDRNAPGEGFLFDASSPASTLQPITGWQPETSATRPVVLWSPQTLDRPELVVWGSRGEGESSEPSAVELLIRDESGTLSSSLVNVPLLRSIDSAVRIDSSAAHVSRPVSFALTDGPLIAMNRLPPQDSWDRLWLPTFPIQLDVIDSQEGTLRYRVGESPPPSQLPHTTQSVRVKLAPAYSRWWISDYSAATLSAEEGLRGVPFSAEGMAQLSLNPGTENNLTVSHVDPLMGDSSSTAGLPLAVLPEPPPPPGPNPLLYISLTVVALGVCVLLAIGANVAWRRAVITWLRGECWNVVAADCHLEGDLESANGRQTLELRIPQDEAELLSLELTESTAWKLPNAGLECLMAKAKGSTSPATLLVEGASDHLANLPLNSLHLAHGEESRQIVSGFIPRRYRVPGRPSSVRRLRVAHLTAIDGSSRADSTVRRRVKAAGFQFVIPNSGESFRETFLAAIAEAHVVLVNGGVESLGFRDPAEISDSIRGRDLRCRMLIVVGSSEGRMAAEKDRSDLTDKQPLLVEFACAGMHVASVQGLASAEAEDRFCTHIVDALLPASGKQPHSLAQSIVDAATAVASGDAAQPAENDCSIVSVRLFGDPSARVASSRSYDAFLSHSHRDRDAVKWLQAYLSRRWLLWMRPRRLCRDQDTLGPEELSRSVPEKLSSSKHLIVCCSPDSARSHWVKREVRYFLRDHSTEQITLCNVGKHIVQKADADALAAFVEWIETRSGRRELLRPNLCGEMRPGQRVPPEVVVEAQRLLVPLTDIPLEVLMRQRTRTWIALILAGLIGLATALAYGWWRQTTGALQAALTESVIADAETGDAVNHPALIPMGTAFGRLNDRDSLERFAQHFGQEDWRSLYLASGYASLPEPDCEAVTRELGKVSEIGLRQTPSAALLAAGTCDEMWLKRVTPPDIGDRQTSAWIEALITHGFVDDAAGLMAEAELYADDALDLELKAGLARGPRFRFSDVFLSKLAGIENPNDMMYSILMQTKELDWRNRLSEPAATQLLEVAVRQFQDEGTEAVVSQRWQQLAAHLVKTGRRDVALDLLQHPPPETVEPSHAETWIWRGLALQRLKRTEDALACYSQAEACAEAPVEMSRTWGEWFEIARVYALADDWKRAFATVDRPGAAFARFQLACFVLQLRSGGPMDSSVLAAVPTN